MPNVAIIRPKMYKIRIVKWGFNKKRKNNEMVFAVRKVAQRRREGKATKLSIRGKDVSELQVEKYFRRRPISAYPSIDDENDPPTPEGLRYSTPSPEPISRNQTTSDARSSIDPDTDSTTSETCSEASVKAADSFHWKLFSDERSCSSFSSLLQYLPVEDKIFGGFKNCCARYYLAGNIRKPTEHVTDGYNQVRPAIVSSKIASGHEADPFKLVGDIQMAIRLFCLGQSQDGVQVMDWAFQMMHQIIRAGHSLFLSALLLMLDRLQANQLYDLQQMLVRYVRDLSNIILEENHPLSEFMLTLSTNNFDGLSKRLLPLVSELVAEHGGDDHPDLRDIHILQLWDEILRGQWKAAASRLEKVRTLHREDLGNRRYVVYMMMSAIANKVVVHRQQSLNTDGNVIDARRVSEAEVPTETFTEQGSHWSHRACVQRTIGSDIVQKHSYTGSEVDVLQSHALLLQDLETECLDDLSERNASSGINFHLPNSHPLAGTLFAGCESA